VPEANSAHDLLATLGKTNPVGQVLLEALEQAYQKIDTQEAAIARLEAGERRYKCSLCSSWVWGDESGPPKGWGVLGRDRDDRPCCLCLDCAASLAATARG